MARKMGSRWYPTQQQLKDPAALERAFRQVLDRHYELLDRFGPMLDKAGESAPAAPMPPPGSGPHDTMLLGLRVLPVDVQTLADGTKLTFSKADGNFQFK